MKKLLFILSLVLFFSSCYKSVEKEGCMDANAENYDPGADISGPCKYIKATATITDVEQEYYSSLNEYGMVNAYFDIKNTGDYDIGYYEVYFTVTLSGGTVLNEWTNGTNVRIGKTISDDIIIDTHGKKCTRIVVDDIDIN